MNVHSSNIHSHQMLGESPDIHPWCMTDKQNMVHPNTSMLLIHLYKWMNYWSKPRHKDYRLCYSSEGRTMATSRIRGCQRPGAGGELTSHGHRGIFRDDGKCPKIRLWWWFHNCANLLKLAVLYSHRGWILWFVHGSSEKSRGKPSVGLEEQAAGTALVHGSRRLSHLHSSWQGGLLPALRSGKLPMATKLLSQDTAGRSRELLHNHAILPGPPWLFSSHDSRPNQSWSVDHESYPGTCRVGFWGIVFSFLASAC